MRGRSGRASASDPTQRRRSNSRLGLPATASTPNLASDWRSTQTCASVRTPGCRRRRSPGSRRPACEHRRQQEAVAEEAVDVDGAAAHHDLRHVVGEGRAHAGAHLDDLGLGERRVQRIGAAEQLERRAHRDRPVIVALDHGGADHVEAVAPRHDVDRVARMQEPHRPLKSISRVRTTTRSPRTPRRSASSPRAPRPRQSMTMSRSAPGLRPVGTEHDLDARAPRLLQQEAHRLRAAPRAPRRHRRGRRRSGRPDRAPAWRWPRHRGGHGLRSGARSARSRADRARRRPPACPPRRCRGKSRATARCTRGRGRG